MYDMYVKLYFVKVSVFEWTFFVGDSFFKWNANKKRFCVTKKLTMLGIIYNIFLVFQLFYIYIFEIHCFFLDIVLKKYIFRNSFQDLGIVIIINYDICIDKRYLWEKFCTLTQRTTLWFNMLDSQSKGFCFCYPPSDS